MANPFRSLLNKLMRSAFAKDAALLSVGAAASQLIFLASIPILARLYDPADFGRMAIFVAWSQILSIPAAGRYERGLLLTSNTIDTIRLFCGMMVLITIWLLLLQVGVETGILQAVVMLSLPGLLPVTACAVAVITVGEFWCTRKGYFGRVALTKVLLAASIVAVQIIVAEQAYSDLGLIYGYAVGQVLVAVVHIIPIVLTNRSGLAATLRDPRCILAVLREHAALPRYSLPAGLLNTVGRQSLIVVSAAFFPQATIGYIEMANRVVRAPMNFLNQTLEKAFVSRLGRNRREGRSNVPLLTRAIRVLTAVALVGGLAAFFLLEPVIAIVLGPEWNSTVIFGLLLLPAVFSNFIVFPVSKMYIYGREKIGLLWQVGYSFGSVLVLVFGGVAGLSVLAVALFGIFSAGMNILHLTLTTRYAGASLLCIFGLPRAKKGN